MSFALRMFEGGRLCPTAPFRAPVNLPISTADFARPLRHVRQLRRTQTFSVRTACVFNGVGIRIPGINRTNGLGGTNQDQR
jgi:hypothetical protein